VHFWIAEYGNNAPGLPYREAAIMLEASRRGRIVCHCPWAVVDDDTYLIWGRDMMGYPKKMGAIEISRDGDAFEVDVVRRGERLWHVTGDVDSATDLDLHEPVMPAETINVWGIPFAPALLIKYENTKDVKYRHPITANIEITGGRTDPLETLNVTNGQAVAGQAFLTDIVLPEPTRLPYWLWGIVGIVRPVGFTSPMWLLRHYVFRSL
jgi:acetoacetate decarboxylase